MEKLLEWQAPDHDLPEKSADWYLSVVAVGVSVAIASLLLNDLLFAIFSILAAISVIIHMAKKPEMLNFTLTNQGIEIRHDFLPYDKLHSFWIDNEKNKNEIVLHSDRSVLPHLIVPLGNLNPEYARTILRQHLPEKYAHKNFLDRALEYLGF